MDRIDGAHLRVVVRQVASLGIPGTCLRIDAMKLVVCTCAECVRLDREHPNEGRQLSLLPKPKRPRAGASQRRAGSANP